MPIWLRNFTFRTISEYYEKEKEAVEKNQQHKGGKVKPPSYVTKARR